MYDFEIAVAVCGKFKYLDRLNDFKKYGLMNIKDVKVSLKILVGSEEIEDVDKNWPESVDVEVIRQPRSHPAAKTYHYYSKIDPSNAKWFIRVDDDSITDIDHTFQILEKWFDWEKEYYLIGDHSVGDTAIEVALSKKLNLESVIEDGVIYHEVEIAILSQATMKAIHTNENSMKYIKERYRIEEGYTDQALSIAAKFCKIYPTQVHFLTSDPNLGNFSLFGGYNSHIHFIANDIYKRIDEFERLKNLFENKDHTLAGDYLELIELLPGTIISLKENGGVRYNQIVAMDTWYTGEDKRICILEQGGKIRKTYIWEDNKYKLVGDPRVTLRKLAN